MFVSRLISDRIAFQFLWAIFLQNNWLRLLELRLLAYLVKVFIIQFFSFFNRIFIGSCILYRHHSWSFSFLPLRNNLVVRMTINIEIQMIVQLRNVFHSFLGICPSSLYFYFGLVLNVIKVPLEEDVVVNWLFH